MLENFELHSQIASKIGYSVSAWLILGKAFNFLNEYAAAFGVILSALAFFVKIRYEHLNHLAIKAQADNESRADNE